MSAAVGLAVVAEEVDGVVLCVDVGCGMMALAGTILGLRSSDVPSADAGMAKPKGATESEVARIAPKITYFTPPLCGMERG